MNIKKFIMVYFNSWYLPALVNLVFLVSCFITWFVKLRVVSTAISILYYIALLGILIAAIWNLIRKQWLKGIVNIFMIPICVIILLFASLFNAFGPSEDGFADDLQIPTDIVVSEPEEEILGIRGGQEDSFQSTMLEALMKAATNDANVTADISMLAELQQKNPEVLRRFLATSPAWRVFQERGVAFATRRWMIGPEWQYELHGYYSKSDLDIWSDSNIPDFQFRLTIGLSGKTWVTNTSGSTQLSQNETKALKLDLGNRNESFCLISDNGLLIEIFEQSNFIERCLTKAALSHIQNELKLVNENPTWQTIQKSLPDGSIRTGKPIFYLRKSFQPGIYNSVIWLNPGEPGMIYLKAFEVTKGIALSPNKLKQYSNEWIGWSNDPNQLFLSNAHFTIYEGDWGKPYAARFEVWFQPDSGHEERKLMEKIFKIQGWQR